MRRLLAILLFLCGPAFAQFSSTAHHVYAGTTLPAHCSATAGDVFVINNTAPTQLYLCTATDTWTASGISACSTTPPTTGTAGQTCYDTAGALWVCHPTGACTTSGNWVAQGTSYTLPTATDAVKGGVTLTTGTSAGIAASSDDPKLTNARSPALVLDTGAANAYTSAAGGPTLADGLIINLRTLHANTAASTLAYNGGGALAIVDQAGSALVSGMISAGNVLLQYQASGTTWRLLDAIKPATAGTADTANTLGALTGMPAQANATMVANVSGGAAAPTAVSIPASAHGLSTGANGAPAAATAHDTAVPLLCADTSSSGTAQSCTTSPSFTPAANDCVIYTTTTANTGAGLTLNVNSLGAKSVAKWLGSTTLVAGDVAAGSPQMACYNGTVWNLSTVGVAPGGSTVNVNTSAVSSPNFNATTPAASTGYTNVAFQVSGSNVSAQIQRQLTATFLLCAGGCYAGETTNWPWFAPFALTFTGCGIGAATYPTGAGNLTVDLLKGGTTTIFSGAVPTLAGGSSAYATDTGMAAGAAMTQGQYLIASVLTVTATLPGQFVTLVCTVTY